MSTMPEDEAIGEQKHAEACDSTSHGSLELRNAVDGGSSFLLEVPWYAQEHRAHGEWTLSRIEHGCEAR